MSAAAQDEHKDEKQQATPPPARHEQAAPAEHRNQEQQNEQRRQEPRQNEHQMKQQQEQERKMDKQQEKMERQQEARPQGQPQGGERHAGNQRHIPDNDFHAHFGREHRFAPGRLQVSSGRPQFRYSGYMFELVEVWPADWAYDADDYYIDYFGDEYYLCSFSHPEIRLELIIIG